VNISENSKFKLSPSKVVTGFTNSSIKNTNTKPNTQYVTTLIHLPGGRNELIKLNNYENQRLAARAHHLYQVFSWFFCINSVLYFDFSVRLVFTSHHFFFFGGFILVKQPLALRVEEK